MNNIRDFISEQPVFDTHSHQRGLDQDWNEKSFEEFIGYGVADMAVAGLPFENNNASRVFEAWQFVQTTGYGQLAQYCVKELYGVNYFLENAEFITAEMQKQISENTPKELYKLLMKKAGIKYLLNTHSTPILCGVPGSYWPALKNTRTDPECF